MNVLSMTMTDCGVEQTAKAETGEIVGNIAGTILQVFCKIKWLYSWKGLFSTDPATTKSKGGLIYLTTFFVQS